nr:unnamed protein product [Callosobruchus analis]
MAKIDQMGTFFDHCYLKRPKGLPNVSKPYFVDAESLVLILPTKESQMLFLRYTALSLQPTGAPVNPKVVNAFCSLRIKGKKQGCKQEANSVYAVGYPATNFDDVYYESTDVKHKVLMSFLGGTVGIIFDGSLDWLGLTEEGRLDDKSQTLDTFVSEAASFLSAALMSGRKASVQPDPHAVMPLGLCMYLALQEHSKCLYWEKLSRTFSCDFETSNWNSRQDIDQGPKYVVSMQKIEFGYIFEKVIMKMFTIRNSPN